MSRSPVEARLAGEGLRMRKLVKATTGFAVVASAILAGGPLHLTDGSSAMKIKVKKVEPIEATRIHLDPDSAPQGAA
jgi:hypothetical protein